MPVLRRAVWTLFSLVAVWIASFALLFASPWGQPALEMDVSSSSAGFSQIFVAGDDAAFAEQRSAWALVPRGTSTIRFPLSGLRGTAGSQLRWDPLDEPSEFLARDMRLTSGFDAEEIPLTLLQPSMATSEIIFSEQGAEFTTQSNDAQVLLGLDTASFIQRTLLRAAFLSVILAVLASALTWIFLGRLGKGSSAWEGKSSSLPLTSTGVSGPGIPRWVLGSLWVATAFGLALLILGSRAIGVSWDESIHEASLEEFFRSGWFIPRGRVVDGIPRLADASVYAPLGALIAHGLGAMTGAHPWFSASYAAGAYEIRHLAVALISVLGLLAVAASARFIFGRWKWSLLAVAATLSIPLFLGHSMFNIKDAPVAAA